MKAIFVTYDQAYNNEIVKVLEKYGQRGFTRWSEVEGRGSEDGEPHYNSHAWPRMNQAIISIVDDALVAPVMAELRAKDEASKDLGLRAFVWNIEEKY